MSSIHIDLHAVLLLSDKFKSESSGVSLCKSAVRQAQNGIDGKILARRNIKGRLANVQNALGELAQDLSAIGSVMESASNLYRRADIEMAQDAMTGTKQTFGKPIL